MHLSPSHRSNRLPKRFPIGTIYVVEGHGGERGNLRVFSRYVVLPDGQRINLSDDFGHLARSASPRARRRLASRHNGTSSAAKSGSNRAKKIAVGAGTTRQRRR